MKASTCKEEISIAPTKKMNAHAVIRTKELDRGESAMEENPCEVQENDFLKKLIIFHSFLVAVHDG